LLERGATAISQDKGQHGIKKVMGIRTLDGWTEMATADSSQAASSATEAGLADFSEVLIPSRGVENLRRFLGGKGDVRVEVRDGVLYATRGTSSMSVRAADPTIAPAKGYFHLIHGNFLESTEQIPARTITVNRAIARETVAAISSAAEMGQVEVTAAGSRMIVRGRGERGEQAEDEVICQIDAGPELKVILSGETVAKILGLAASDRVTIRIAENNGPVLVKEIGELEARAFWLTMPIMPTAYAGRESARVAEKSAESAGDAGAGAEAKPKPKGTRKKKGAAGEAPAGVAGTVAAPSADQEREDFDGA
jgi:DNA polymerase III sliding clamp (beta) subunit (PCNA family)